MELKPGVALADSGNPGLISCDTFGVVIVPRFARKQIAIEYIE